MRTDAELLRTLYANTAYRGDCWLWTRSCNKWGYGQIAVGHGHATLPRVTQIHIVSHYLFTGEHGGKGSALHHVCGNRTCWNPAHLQAMTQREHGLLHHWSETCPRGHTDFRYSLQTHKRTYKRTCRICNREAVRALRARRKAAA